MKARRQKEEALRLPCVGACVRAFSTCRQSAKLQRAANRDFSSMLEVGLQRAKSRQRWIDSKGAGPGAWGAAAR